MQMSVVIIGASQGLGEALCKVFQANGRSVVGASRNVQSLAELEQSTGIATFACDVCKEAEMLALMKFAKDRFGGISTLVYCVGVNFDEMVVDWESAQAFRHVVEINLIGAANALHAAMPYLMLAPRNNPAQIVVLTSLAGVLGCVPGGSAYAASKAGLDAMFTSCAPELKPLGINVLIVDPGSMHRSPGARERQVLGNGTQYRSGRNSNTSRKSRSVEQVAEIIYRVVQKRQTGRLWSTHRVFVLGALAVKYFIPSLMERIALRVRSKNTATAATDKDDARETDRFRLEKI